MLDFEKLDHARIYPMNDRGPGSVIEQWTQGMQVCNSLKMATQVDGGEESV